MADRPVLTALPGPLTPTERAILRFEDTAVHGRLYEQRVWDRFGLTLTRYGQILHRLLDDPRAEAWDAETVARLRQAADRRLRGPAGVRSRGLGYVTPHGDRPPPAA
jgi:hypothetical protein